MSLRQKFLAYLIVLHSLFIPATLYFLRGHRVWIIVFELIFVTSFIVGWRLLRKLTQPVEFVRQSAEILDSGDFTTRFLETKQPDIDRLIRLYNRLVDHLREERVMNQEQEAFLRRIIDVSPSGMITLDLDGRIRSLNPAAGHLLGEPAAGLAGRSLAEVGGDFGRQLAGIADGESRLLAIRGRRRVRCRRLSFQDRGFSRPFLLLDELTRELHESEKAAYEKLIRMMSHEINNTSGAVISLLESCLNYARQIADGDRDDFENGLTVAMSRTRHMNRFMKGFADVVRLPPPNRRPCRPDEILEAIAQLTRVQCEERRIRWRWQLAPDFPEVSADREQLEQALLNVVKNAIEAIGEDGEIHVRTETGPPRPILRVIDSGGGIPAEVEPKLFSSFYTSKPGGHGIGLTLVQEILLNHGFDFALENSATGRAEFRIEF